MSLAGMTKIIYCQCLTYSNQAKLLYILKKYYNFAFSLNTIKQ